MHSAYELKTSFQWHLNYNYKYVADIDLKISEDILAKIFETAQCDLKKFRTDFSSSHPSFSNEEDTVLHNNVGLTSLIVNFAPKETNAFTWFINQQNKDYTYQYHQAVFQMLHDVDPPQTHWQLKSPLHTLWIDTVLKYYPQASIIMSHRRLDEVLPSIYRHSLTLCSPYFTEDNLINSKRILDEMVPKCLDIWIDRIIEFHKREPSPKNIFHIQYEDLIKDPIGVLRKIYDHFDFLQWSDQFEKSMKTWLIDNPQGKQGRYSYSLAEFGLETQMNKQIYKDYEKLFLSK